MQSTGQTVMQDLSLTPIQGSVTTYGTIAIVPIQDGSCRRIGSLDRADRTDMDAKAAVNTLTELNENPITAYIGAVHRPDASQTFTPIHASLTKCDMVIHL